MAYLTLILIALSLSMDAFCVSIIDGLTVQVEKRYKLFLYPLAFGIFQALMPLIGYYISSAFLEYIDQYDHYISFAILVLIGLKSTIDGIKDIKSANKEKSVQNFSYLAIILQALATSIDALAIGFTISSDIPINIYICITIIGLLTLVICTLGLLLGKQISKVLKGHIEIAQIIGGVILILIGIKLLLSGLNIINF